MNDLLPIVLLIGAIWVIPKLKLATNVLEVAKSVRVEGFKVKFSGSNAQIFIHVINPSSVTLHILALAGTLIVNGLDAGIVHYDKVQTLPGAGDVTLTTDVKINVINNVLAALSTMANKNPSYDIQFKGNINIDGNLLPINVEYHF